MRRPMIGCVVWSARIAIVLSSAVAAAAFEWTAGGKQPEVDRLALAGLWRLTPRVVPMKEFTVHPKRRTEKPPDYLLMLKEDGSFQQYKNDEEVDVDVSWSRFRQKREEETLEEVTKGKWDFIDGKLILAADRPESDRARSPSPEDKLLVGRVVATYETPLNDNPVVKSPEIDNSNEAASTFDAHLSVPRGSIKTGKFMYPTRHPSFFEQPMFQPKVKRFAFSLQQVLGSLNARQRRGDEMVEKFKNADFYNRTFLLTSHPIPPRRPKGHKRWSTKLNRFVDDPPSKEAQKAQEDERNAPVPIRVMQIVFHRNNTFSTVAGLGEAILRGKWDVIGQEKDQLWMQIWRFGFGRSVSGSTYSEGKFLTHEDAKSYWGTIRVADSSSATRASESDGDGSQLISDASQSSESSLLEVAGSVLFGSGLEPLPVARFIMKEVTQVENSVADDDEEEDDEESAILKKLEEGGYSTVPMVDGIDWSDEAFQ